MAEPGEWCERGTHGERPETGAEAADKNKSVHSCQNVSRNVGCGTAIGSRGGLIFILVVLGEVVRGRGWRSECCCALDQKWVSCG
jgi:hypothetical protein